MIRNNKVDFSVHVNTVEDFGKDYPDSELKGFLYKKRAVVALKRFLKKLTANGTSI
jgi:hypothetical protein